MHENIPALLNFTTSLKFICANATLTTILGEGGGDIWSKLIKKIMLKNDFHK